MNIRAGDYVLRSDVDGGFVVARVYVAEKGKRAGQEVEKHPACFGKLEHAVSWLIGRISWADPSTDPAEWLRRVESVCTRVCDDVREVA